MPLVVQIITAQRSVSAHCHLQSYYQSNIGLVIAPHCYIWSYPTAVDYLVHRTARSVETKVRL